MAAAIGYDLALSLIASLIDHPLIVKIPVNSERVQRASEMLKSRLVVRNEDQFQIWTDTVDHSDMDRCVVELLDKYKDTDEEFRSYIKRLPVNKAGQQFAKAFVFGTESWFSVSVIATSRRQTATSDMHKILIATIKKTVRTGLPAVPNIGVMGAAIAFLTLPITLPLLLPVAFMLGTIAWSTLWSSILPVFNVLMDDQLRSVLGQLKDEENKQCMEAMAFHILGVKIQESVGDRVVVQFVRE